jgi:nitroreductase
MSINTNHWKRSTRAIIDAASRAPSSHNTQPWVFRAMGSDIELWADHSRALPENDPANRELVISCGCALLNLRVCAAGDGLDAHVELLPEPGEQSLLARVSLAEQTKASLLEAHLALFIQHRRTYRQNFAPREVEPDALDDMMAAASYEGAQLHPLQSKEARDRVAGLVAEGDAAQWADPNWRHELATWTRPAREGDGLRFPLLPPALARAVIDRYNLGRMVAANDHKQAVSAPLLAVLSTYGETPADWLLAGQALQRLLLVACQHGLQASFLNQPIQVAALRPAIQSMIAGGVPQIILRVGYPCRDIAPTARRPLDEFIEFLPAE